MKVDCYVMVVQIILLLVTGKYARFDKSDRKVGARYLKV